MVKKIKELVSKLNKYRDSYYNEQISIVTDYEYDKLFDELKQLEENTGIILSNSPTQTVGYKVKSELEKIKHSHPMLSLDKTKSTDDLKRFAADNDCLLSLKLDGLTILLTYENGELVQAETRGDGEEGEIVTHNAKVFDNIPLRINYQGHLEVEGEAIITYDDFKKINEPLVRKATKEANGMGLTGKELKEYIRKHSYANPRNLASGSVRQLDNSITEQRHVKFIAWKVPTDINNFPHNNSFLFKLKYLSGLGFDIVPLLSYANKTYDEEHIEDLINHLKNEAEKYEYPIDGLVITYDDINFGKSLGYTEHHPKHSLAFKFDDDKVETELIDIDWTVGKSGQITPTAIFKPVDIDGAVVERASVHNISILTKLELLKGDTITVYKANQIIPQIFENLSAIERHKNNIFSYTPIPAYCPVCGGETKIICENETNVLICANDSCKGKLLGRLKHFVSKNAMNIDGLSEATLEKFINLGWLNSVRDVYFLSDHYNEMVVLDGFGEKSVSNMINAIDSSMTTTLDRFINALSIPLIGKTASKDIAKHCNYDFKKFIQAVFEDFNWCLLDGFGENMKNSIQNYFYNNPEAKEALKLADILNFTVPETTKTSNDNLILSGKIFVITGSLNTFANRDKAKEKIESLGGKVVGSISNKTNYLINNDITSNSGKNKKAKELNISIITEKELLSMME